MNFKKMSCRLLIAFGFVASATGAMAQSSATTNGTATATVIRPITIAAGLDLAFGNVVKTGAAETLIVTAGPSPTVTPSSPALQPGSQKGTITAGTFTVGGEGTFTYSISLPLTATITSAASDTMTVDTFTSSAATGTLSGAAGTLGGDSFYVGGKLHVGANQAAGSYTGTYPVTVAYN